MAIDLRSTSSVHSSGLKMLVYGTAGAGKTSLIPTLPNPVIISAEGGLLSISDAGLPFVEIRSLSDLSDVLAWLADSAEASQFESVAVDSISEIAEVCLSAEKARAKDPRQAYGAMSEAMVSIVRTLRDLPRHIYMSAKLDKVSDETGRILYSPSMPGAKTGQSLPYLFDEVFALRVEKSDDGSRVRALLTDSDGSWLAKDRSGKLDQWEPPHLGDIIVKIGAKCG